MPNPLVECVPNFSEGRDESKIAQIVDAVISVSDIELLNVDPGWDTNRTVVTFVGSPRAVAEAAFRAITEAARVIDMRKQHGVHPRIGATDVVPFVPIEGVTLAECAEIARQVGRRVGEELQIPVYLYEAAAAVPERANLADIRKGEYEGLAEKLKDPRWKPDFGPAEFNPRAGATAIGAREFLIAYNITLNTRDKDAAADIALELRERGRVARGKTDSPYYNRGEILCYRKGHYPCGNCDFVGKSFRETEEHCRSAHGYELRELAKEDFADTDEPIGIKVRRAGKFKFCKAIGWYADAFRRAQISINLTDYRTTPPHLVLEEARKLAALRGLVVTGSEIVGMIPYAALLEAGNYYLEKQGAAANIPTLDILETAVFSLGLNDLQPFEIADKVIGLPHEIENTMARQAKKCLLDRQVRIFVDDVARPSPTPAGGSVAALAGSLGAALAAMAAKIARRKTGGDRERDDALSRLVETALAAEAKLLQSVDDDAEAYRAYLDAKRMPAPTANERELRTRKIQDALKRTIDVPYRTALAGIEAMQAARDAARYGPPAVAADAALGCETAFVCVRGSLWNIAANLKQIDDPEYVERIQAQSAALLENAQNLRRENENVFHATLGLLPIRKPDVE
ncbi:MAG: glutamate formimidoyltransferase [Pirellulales bacterium]|nr:glutamate formimidoyltransferase [Pirellulales bacterium]